MFKKLSIKARLFILAFVTVVGVLSIHLCVRYFNAQNSELSHILSEVETIKVHVLTLRKHEKTFLQEMMKNMLQNLTMKLKHLINT